MTRDELIKEFNKAPNYDDEMPEQMKTILKLAILQEDWETLTEMMRISVRKTREECADICIAREKAIHDAYDEYLKLIGDELDELASIASVHGWKTTRHEAGVKARETINRLRGDHGTK